MEENGLNENNFSVCYYNTVTGESYSFNENKMMDAASTYKLPLNMYYYEQEAAGKISGSDYLPYAGTTLGNCHMQSIVWSNNELSQAMRKNLGAYSSYKILMRQYTEMPEEEIDPSFYTGNRYCTRMMMDILKYLYENQDSFSELIGYMKEAMPGQYFKKYVTDCEIAHKYGSNEGSENDVGIFYAGQPFLLAVYTKYVGTEIVSKAALLLKDYTDAQYESQVLRETIEGGNACRIAAQASAAAAVHTALERSSVWFAAERQAAEARHAALQRAAEEDEAGRIAALRAQEQALTGESAARREGLLIIAGVSIVLLAAAAGILHGKKRIHR